MKLSLFTYKSFSDRIWSYEMIGIGLCMTYFVKSQKFCITEVFTGLVMREGILEKKIEDVHAFEAYAKDQYLSLVDNMEILKYVQENPDIRKLIESN